MLCQSIASWHSANFKLKAFEKLYVQEGLSELPSEAGHHTLMSDAPSLFPEERNVLIFRTPRPVSAGLAVYHLLHLAHSHAMLSHFPKTPLFTKLYIQNWGLTASLSLYFFPKASMSHKTDIKYLCMLFCLFVCYAAWCYGGPSQEFRSIEEKDGISKQMLLKGK